MAQFHGPPTLLSRTLDLPLLQPLWFVSLAPLEGAFRNILVANESTALVVLAQFAPAVWIWTDVVVGFGRRCLWHVEIPWFSLVIDFAVCRQSA